MLHLLTKHYTSHRINAENRKEVGIESKLVQMPPHACPVSAQLTATAEIVEHRGKQKQELYSFSKIACISLAGLQLLLWV